MQFAFGKTNFGSCAAKKLPLIILIYTNCFGLGKIWPADFENFTENYFLICVIS